MFSIKQIIFKRIRHHTFPSVIRAGCWLNNFHLLKTTIGSLKNSDESQLEFFFFQICCGCDWFHCCPWRRLFNFFFILVKKCIIFNVLNLYGVICVIHLTDSPILTRAPLLFMIPNSTLLAATKPNCGNSIGWLLLPATSRS